MSETITKVTSLPQTRQAWTKQGAVPMVMTPEAFDKYARDDIAKWDKVTKTANIKVD